MCIFIFINKCILHNKLSCHVTWRVFFKKNQPNYENCSFQTVTIIIFYLLSKMRWKEQLQIHFKALGAHFKEWNLHVFLILYVRFDRKKKGCQNSIWLLLRKSLYLVIYSLNVATKSFPILSKHKSLLCEGYILLDFP